MKNVYYIEVTDTFGGEANYSWVKRYKVKAKTIRGAMTVLARSEGGGWRFNYGNSESARYNLRGACVCAFVEPFDRESHVHYDLIEIN